MIVTPTQIIFAPKQNLGKAIFSFNSFTVQIN